MRMKQLITALPYFLSLFIYSSDGQSAQRPSVKLAPHMEALQVYLDLDHEDVLGKADEKREPLQSLQKILEFKKDLEPEFFQLLLGKELDNEVLQKRTRFLEEQWVRREAFLKKKLNLGLKGDDLAALRSITKEDYVKAGREKLIQRYQEKAIGALHAINTPTAILVLRDFRAKTGNRILQEIIDHRLPIELPPEKPAMLRVN